MSGMYVNPQILSQSPLRAGSTDLRYYALGDDLTPLGATVASITSVVAVRSDGAAIGAGDLSISTSSVPYLSADHLTVYWWETGTLTAMYKISVTVVTSDGRTLVYDCLQLVTNQLS